MRSLQVLNEFDMEAAVNVVRASLRENLCATPALHRIKQSARNKIKKKREERYVPFVVW